MSNISSKLSRKTRRTKRTRYKIIKSCRKNNVHRLSVYKSNLHIYAQVINDIDGKTVAAASTLDSTVLDSLGITSKTSRCNRANSKAAAALGSIIADKAKKSGIDTVIFDRGGYVYHGIVKTLADAAREGGLKF